MQIYDALLIAAGIAGAIFTIYKTAAKAWELISKCINFFRDMSESVKRQENEQKSTKKQLEEMSEKIQTLEEHSEENYMGVLQLRIMSSEMPLEERLRAGERYVNNKGNGAVKAKYKQLQHEYEKEAEKHE